MSIVYVIRALVLRVIPCIWACARLSVSEYERADTVFEWLDGNTTGFYVVTCLRYPIRSCLFNMTMSFM